MVLDAEAHVLAKLLTTVSREHPAVNLKLGPPRPGERGRQVIALASGRSEHSIQAVDAALFDVERAAGAARLQVSSIGRTAAHEVCVSE